MSELRRRNEPHSGESSDIRSPLNSALAYPMIIGASHPRLKKRAPVASHVIKSPRSFSVAWIAIPLCALGFLLWMNVVRIRHIESVSLLGGGSEKPPVAVSASAAPDSAAGNHLIVPEQLTESYHWLAQTQLMFNRGEWRVRHIDYENVPEGRTVHTSSLYRWWLGSLAWGDHLMSGRSPAQAVERAALIADPILHFLLFLGATALVAWRFGVLPAMLFSIGCVTLFPFAAGYLPGAPDDRGLTQIFALGSVLLLAAGVRTSSAPDDGGKSTRRWFSLAGVVGGIGLWLSVSVQGPVLVGVIAGALLSAWMTRPSNRGESAGTDALPWRAWAVAGSVTTLCAYLIEFAPAHLSLWDWQLSHLHPLYGLAWLGAGEILAQGTEWIQTKKNSRTARSFTFLALAVIAIAAVPVAIWKTDGSWILFPDSASLRLTKLPNGAVARSFAEWISRDGLTPTAWVTLLPLVLIAPAVWFLLRKETARVRRVSLAITLGPVIVALGFACYQLVWWNTLDGFLLVLLVVMTAGLPQAANQGYARLAWVSGTLLLSLGVLFVVPSPASQTENNLTRSEVLGLIERDLAGWLALHGDPAGVVVLAPPNESTALYYYGGLRGMGSVSWENKGGVEAAVLILKNQNLQEAKDLIDRHKITHIVLFSWDSGFDDYTRTGTGQNAGTLRDQLQLSTLPLWLRPLAYPLPTIPGFDGQSVTVLEVVDEQELATGVSRIAEYLVEMGDLNQAAAAAEGLQRYPADFGAWVARAEVEMARGDEAGLAKSLKALQARLAVKAPLALPFDQRVGLAVVLARAKQEKLAREQVTACLKSADEGKLRALSPGSLYRLLVLSRGFEIPMDPKLHEFALTLVPPELRDRVR